MTRTAQAVSVLVAALMFAGCEAGSVPTGSPTPRSSAAPSSTLAADWTEYHGGPGRSGLGPSSPPLDNPRKAWDSAVDGAVYASPLIVGGHVLAATENNTVYSLDLFSGAVVWKTHLGEPVAASSLPCGNISPVTGITGTPAVDPTSGRLYVVAFLAGMRHVLFTLKLVDGSVITQRVIDPNGSVPAAQQQRGALSIGSGYVYVTFGGLFGDCGDYHGYVQAVPLAGGQTLTYRTPVAREAGIWSPAGATISASGSVYVVTGNGEPSATFAYSNAVIRLSPDLHVQSFFAPSNWKDLDAGDVDLGSVGATLLPSFGVVVAIGKEGVAYVLGADQLGGIGGQRASRKVCSGALGGSARSETDSMVWVPCSDGLVALSVTRDSIAVAWRAPRPSLGSPIMAAGVLWAIEPGSGTLFALNPASGAIVYSTSLGSARQFSTPGATEGFVVAPAGTHVIAISTAG
ncbi:MAG TPA: PQQ-binding-like beta-propeller repeat protein [Candidatus Dormibacteraeota bacterium]